MRDQLNPDTAPVEGGDAPASEPQGGDQGTWRTIVPKALADEYRETLSGFESSEDFFRKGLESINSVGQFEGRVMVPQEGASDEDWKAYYTAIGRPEDGKGYEVENDFISDLYLKANLSKQQADILSKGFVEISQQDTQQTEAEKKKAFAEAIDTLKAQHGEQFDAKMKTAQTAVLNLGGPDLSSLLKKKGLDNDPEMIGFFISLGELMQEGHIPAHSRKTPSKPGLTGMYESMKGI